MQGNGRDTGEQNKQVNSEVVKAENKRLSSEEVKERNEQVKQWLWRYREAKKDIHRLEEELKELMSCQESAGAIEYSDMPKGGGGQGDLSDYMVEREKIWRKIHKARYKRIMVCQEVKGAIDRLPSADEREILSGRYIIGKSWEKICVDCDYEWAQMHRIHCKALEKIYEFIKDDTK